ncbi:MAG TPA: ABC transporter ATP-binding protein [Acidimicrobiales bacterium]|nr:ABC transporter ATP-binding protein [Acidimicrobiales bacterium]
MNVISLSDMTVFYGPVRGVSGVSLTVGEGEIVALLGANGAGKSTVLKAISGLVKPREGELVFRGDDLRRIAPATRVRRGLVQVPEGRRIFPSLTVRENLELAGFGVGGGRAQRRERLQAVLERFPLLGDHLPRLAGMLSGGEQQVLAIARGMMAEPKLLMVDEPSLGLAPQMVESVYDLLVQIASEGTAVLLVEQNVTLAFEITNRAYVLQQGEVVLSGPSSELADDPRVVAAYLGRAAASPAAGS